MTTKTKTKKSATGAKAKTPLRRTKAKPVVASRQGSRAKKNFGQVKSAAKNQVALSKIKITLSDNAASPHVVNLKNPNQRIFSSNYVFTPPSRRIAHSASISIPKPPRQLPKPLNRTVPTGINFMSSLGLPTNKTNKLSVKSQGSVPAPAKASSEPQATTLVASQGQKDIVAGVTIDPLADGEIEDIFAPPKKTKPTASAESGGVPFNWKTSLAVFTLVAFALVVPLQAFTYYQDLQTTKEKILLITNEAIASLKSGQQSVSDFDLSLADLQFDQAKNDFVLAKKQIEELNFLTEQIIQLLPSQGKSVNAGVALLEAGQVIAESGQILINGGEKFLHGNNLTDYYYSLAGFRNNLQDVIGKFNQAKTKIESLTPEDLPAEHQETFTKILKALPKVEKGLTDLYTINSALLKILGHEQWQRYLLVFLNNNELRGSGGFMGSFGLLDIDRGEMKNLEIPGGGTYDLQGWLGPQVIAPEPLHLINARWEFQDANWWADFPTTAKKIEWFHQNSNGPSVDGVITITSTFIERLLAITGPVSMAEYGRDAITAENFVTETQKIVQLEYDKEENRPKQFIADLAPKLIEKLFTTDKDNLKKIFELLQSSLNEKQLMIYFNDPQLENLMVDLGWAGELRHTDGDYLSVIHTNLAGGKTDGVIQQIIDHTAEVQADGSIIDTIKLIRRHTGVPGADIFTGVQNNSYVRFYVPLGSQLLLAQGFKKPADNLFEKPSADYRNDFDLISVETDRTKDEISGTDIYKENGKTVFGNWLQLKPGEVQEVTIKYKLPFKLSLEGENTFYYSLLAQKQPGSLGSQIKSYLKLNGKLKPMAKYPATLSSDDTGVGFADVLDIDRFYGVALYGN